MSLKTLVEKVEQDVEKVFEGVEGELKSEIIPAAIAATNALKVITDLDPLDLIGYIAGKAGAAYEEKVKTALPGVINKLQLAQQFLNLTDPNAIIAAVAKALDNATPDLKAKFWIEFAATLSSDLAENQSITLTTAQAIQLSQWVFTNYPAA